MGRSREGAWIEISRRYVYNGLHVVAPVRERGLKSNGSVIDTNPSGRSREGAWIEINACSQSPCSKWVAPVRERGLKSKMSGKEASPLKSLP